ncbi:MAG TPA: beta-ketoacyl-[acyl-carrier-protein] synthase family protein [Isosphaeraceae bacterium]|nr:beta-ketoacyl-[acyl-carrier-protein] synthase family protein [Isosphaeraceae bacterium]
MTGVGLSTGLNRPGKYFDGRSAREDSWEAIKAGRSAVRVLDRTRAPDNSRILGSTPVIHPIKNYEYLYDILRVAVDDAAHDAGLGRLDYDRDRAAALIGLSKGGFRHLTIMDRLIRDDGPEHKMIGWHWPQAWPSHGATLVAARFGLRGPSEGPVAACATGLVAVLQGTELIRRGVCDLVFAGAADASLEPLLLASFRKMKILARCNEDDDPTGAVRPWDKRRSGFVVGEGGAVFILERADHARARGVLPYAEVAGGALGADAYHETNLNPDPTNLAGLIGRALESADVKPSEIDYVNVHGTATRDNDPLECRALRMALGPEADRVSCSANKAQIGHLLGAAGAAELAITCLAIRDGFVPPTLNLTDPDPACDLDGTPQVGRARSIRAALKLSLGFGGHLAACVLRRPDGPRRGPVDA